MKVVACAGLISGVAKQTRAAVHSCSTCGTVKLTLGPLLEFGPHLVYDGYCLCRFDSGVAKQTRAAVHSCSTCGTVKLTLGPLLEFDPHFVYDGYCLCRFDSGSSWAGVLSRPGLQRPADLYLEGSDQHRGRPGKAT